MNRAYSLLEIKSIDEDSRIIEGIATTPSTDRVGDIIEPKGAVFKLPVPFMWQHGKDPFVGPTPVGNVVSAKVTADGIPVRIQMERSDQPGRLKDILDFAWEAVKKRLVRGLSIGFNPLEMTDIKGTFGQRFVKWEWLELSGVTIAANQDASIVTLKSIIDTVAPAAIGNGDGSVKALGVSSIGLPARKGARAMTITEQIAAFEAKRAASSARMNEIQTKAVDEGRGKDDTEREEFDTLKKEVASIDSELVDLRDLEQANRRAAKPVVADTPAAAAASRSEAAPVITVKENRPVGIGFARAAMCMMRARLDNRYAPEVAKEYWPSDQELHAYLSVQKGAVPAGTTTQTVWASPLVYATNLASEFVEFLRPQTIVGRIPGLRRVPFNVRFNGQTSGGTGYWVGEGAPKPLTSFAFEANTLTYTKVAAISVITQELARFSTPSAEMLV